MDYYYIISYHFCDVYDYLFSDLDNCGYARFSDNATYTFPGNFLNRYVLPLANPVHPRPVRMIAKLIGYSYFLRKWTKGVPKNARLCFIIMPRWMTNGMSDWIRVRYPDARFVCFLSDLVSTHKDSARFLEKRRDKADLIYTYDPGDAQKYGLRLRNLPCSDLSRFVDRQYQPEFNFVSGTDHTPYQYDICFVGQDKNRLSDILHICNNLTERGFKCSFHMIRIPKEKQVVMPGVHYHRSFLSYKECLQLSARSRCILELLQPGSCGNTLRVTEAITLNRKLLSNNPALPDNEYYVPGNMLSFQKIEDIPDSFFTTECKRYSDSLREKISPRTMLLEIDEALRTLE